MSYAIKLPPAERLMNDSKTLLDLLNMDDLKVFLRGYEFQAKRSLKLDQPWGVYGNWSVGNGAPIACLPVTDAEAAVEVISLSLGADWEIDAQSRTYRLQFEGEEPIYFLREVDGWLFGATMLEAFETLPSDPSKLFVNDASGAIVAEVYGSEVTSEQVESLLELAERGRQIQRLSMTREEREVFDASEKNADEQLRLMATKLDVMRLELELDSQTSDLRSSFEILLTDDSTMPSLMAISDHESEFRGVAFGSAVNVTMSLDFDPQSMYAEQLKTSIREFLLMEREFRGPPPRGQNQPGVYDPEIFSKAIQDAADATIDTGRVDVAFSMFIDATQMPRILFQAKIDQAALDQLEEETINVIEFIDEISQGQLNTAINATRTGDVRWHKFDLPLPGNFGNPNGGGLATPQFWCGFGPDTWVLSFGQDALQTYSDAAKESKRLNSEAAEAGSEADAKEVKEVRARVDLSGMFTDPDNDGIAFQFPRAIEEHRAGKPFVIDAFADGTPTSTVLEIRISKAVLVAAGDRINDVFDLLDALDQQ